MKSELEIKKETIEEILDIIDNRLDEHESTRCALNSVIKDKMFNFDEREKDNYFIIKDGKLLYYIGTEAEIKIPKGVTSIADKAFMGCEFLKKIEIPDTVTDIGNLAFYNCKNLESINIPDNVTSIKIMAFGRCTGLKEVQLSQNLEKLEFFVFTHCSNLEKLNIPKKIKVINDIGENLASLKSINVDATNKNFSSIDGVLYNKNQEKIIQYPMGRDDKKYTIPNIVKEIGKSAFENSNIEKIIIPKSIKKINKHAFFACKKLKSVEIPNSVEEMGDCVFANCYSLKDVDFKAKVDVLPRATFAYCPQIENIKLPSNVKQVKRLVFEKCTNLKEITTPRGTEFDNSVFGENISIEDANVKIIEDKSEEKEYKVHDLDELLECVEKESEKEETTGQNIDNNEIEL